MAGGFGGWLDVQLENRAFNGNTLALTALLDGSVRKVYTVTFYDGSTVSLLWFYSDGGLVYNAEFSLLPGNVPAGDAE